MAVLKYTDPATGQVRPVNPPVHAHDDRYYTEAEVDALLAQMGNGTATTITVATTSSPPALAAGATYLCDGTDDDVEIQAALDALPDNGGEVVLLPGSYDIGASIIMWREQQSLRFTPGALVRWLTVTGRTPLIRVVRSNCLIWNAALQGSGEKGNGIGIQIGGHAADDAAIVALDPTIGGDQPGGVQVLYPSMTRLDTCLEFGIELNGSQSSGDNTLWGGRLRKSKVGVNSAGFVNYVRSSFISECDVGIRQTAGRYSGRIVATETTINQSASAAIELLRGRGSTFSNLWIEHTATQSAVPTELIRIAPSGSDEVINPSFYGVTHLHPIDIADGTPELYGLYLDGQVLGLHIDHLEFTDELPSSALVRLGSTYSGDSNVIDRVSFGNDIPAAYDHSMLLSRDPAAVGPLIVRSAPTLGGTIAGRATPEVGLQYKKFTLGVSGSPNSATYWAVDGDGHVVSQHADTAITSGLKAVIEDCLAIDTGSPKHVHFGQGRFHFLDAPLGNESWAGEEDHVSWGSSGSVLNGLLITGEGIDSTIISNRSNYTAGSDTEPLSFTNATEVTIRDLTVESCGFYRGTTDAIDGDQAARVQISRVLVRRSRSRAIVLDGGDPGKNSRHNVIDSVVVQGRPPMTGLYPTAGGSLAASTDYSYCLTWTDMDMAGAGVAGETRPSDHQTVATTASNLSVRLMIPRAPYSVTQTNIYRRSTPDGGWVLIGSVAGNEPTTFLDDGTAVTSAATFTLGSTIPQAGIELLGVQETLITNCIIDGNGDGDSASVQYGINLVRKSIVPTSCDKNVVTGNLVRGSMQAGLRIAGGNDNLLMGNTVINVGVPAAKVNGIRLEGLTGTTTNRNRIIGNRVMDDRTADHPEGGGGMSQALYVNSTTSPTLNAFHGNIVTDYSTAAAVFDSGTDTDWWGNQDDSGPLHEAVTNDQGISSLWKGTQAEYDALTPDPTTLYFIV